MDSHLGKITPAGKTDIAKGDVLAALNRPDWLTYLQRIFGDTSDTIAKNKVNNAAWHALCDAPAA